MNKEITDEKKKLMTDVAKEVWQGDWLKVSHFDINDTATRNVNVEFNIIVYSQLCDTLGEDLAKEVITKRIMAHVFHKIHKL